METPESLENLDFLFDILCFLNKSRYSIELHFVALIRTSLPWFRGLEASSSVFLPPLVFSQENSP
jgi:hypothetical protein